MRNRDKNVFHVLFYRFGLLAGPERINNGEVCRVMISEKSDRCEIKRTTTQTQRPTEKSKRNAETEEM